MRTVDPRTARLPQALARQYLDQGRSDLAAAALEKAAQRDPKLPEIHLMLARIHLDEGRFDDAAHEIERELAIAPESAEAQTLKSQIEAARTKPQRARTRCCVRRGAHPPGLGPGVERFFRPAGPRAARPAGDVSRYSD